MTLVIVASACAGPSATPVTQPLPSESTGAIGEQQPGGPIEVQATPTGSAPAPAPPETDRGSPEPDASAAPDPEPTPTEPTAPQPDPQQPDPQQPPPTEPEPNPATAVAKYSYSMYRARTHSPQRVTAPNQTWYCVPASIQMMLNLIKGDHDRSRAGQDKYYRYAQDNSRYPIIDKGADAAGWAAAMGHWGGGNYTVGVHDSMQASLQAAAKRMRLTGKPVGMIVWGNRGGHAWVMTGFKSTADPKDTDSYTVTSVQAMGPLWPYGTINGKPFDPGPREWVGYSELKNKFTENVQRSAPDWNHRWLTVLP
jgi:hypothetical protein